MSKCTAANKINKVLVTGVNGQLGYDVVLELLGRGIICVGSGRTEKYSGRVQNALLSKNYIKMDITDRSEVLRVVRDIAPNVIIHCAAWTAVDLAEEKDNQNVVYNINVTGTENVASAAKESQASMMYISTDYVFDGSGNRPWRPGSRHLAPLNYYGETKLQGEFVVRSMLDRFFIVRTEWTFGVNGNNFVRNIINTGRTQQSVSVVCDQIGSPTSTEDLARLLADLVLTDKYGCYHAVNSGEYISWYEFCKVIFSLCGIETEVVPMRTAEYKNTKAVRPLNSRMDVTKLEKYGFSLLPYWKDALKRYLIKEGFISGTCNS